MRHTLALVFALLAAGPAAAAGCDGRYEGLLTVKSAQGMSVAPLINTNPPVAAAPR